MRAEAASRLPLVQELARTTWHTFFSETNSIDRPKILRSLGGAIGPTWIQLQSSCQRLRAPLRWQTGTTTWPIIAHLTTPGLIQFPFTSPPLAQDMKYVNFISNCGYSAHTTTGT